MCVFVCVCVWSVPTALCICMQIVKIKSNCHLRFFVPKMNTLLCRYFVSAGICAAAVQTGVMLTVHLL